MIEVIQGADLAQRADIVDQMYRMRARVFNDILKWDVSVENGRERDRFDELDPLYIVSICEKTGVLQGSVRLLPTTGPNMLSEVFFELFKPGEEVVSPLVWESSRFSIDPDLNTNRSNSSLNSVTIELLCGMVEIGLYSGISYIVSVYDQRMTRVFRRAKCDAEIIGGPRRFGKVPTFAGLFDITKARWEAIASTGAVDGSVLAPSQRHLSGLVSPLERANVEAPQACVGELENQDA